MKPHLIIIAALAASACNSSKPLIKEHTLSVKDSVSVVWRIVDTVSLARPGASVKLTLPVPPQTTDTTTHARQQHAELTLSVKDGLLQADCTCDSLLVQAKQYEKEINRLRETRQDTVTPVITNELTSWQRFFYRLGLLTALLTVGTVGWKLSKIFKR